MSEEEVQVNFFRSITSFDYACGFIRQASLGTLKKCLGEVGDRPHSGTLRTMIEARIRRLEGKLDLGTKPASPEKQIVPKVEAEHG